MPAPHLNPLVSRRPPSPLAGLRVEGDLAVRLVFGALVAGLAVASAVLWRSLV